MNKKGIALVVTIMIVLLLSILSAGMLFTIKSESAISTYQAQSVQVVAVAEAALDEVKYRMKLSPADADFVGDTSKPLRTDWKTIIVFNTSVEDEDATDHTFFQTSLQSAVLDDPEVPELDYTTFDYVDGNSLTISHKTNEDGTKIYYFDSKTQKQFLGGPELVELYPPVEIIEITARCGKAVKKIMAEVSKQQISINLPSAISSPMIAMRFTGNDEPFICGHNHKLSTPTTVAPYMPGTTQPFAPPADDGSMEINLSPLPDTTNGKLGNGNGNGGGAYAISCWAETVVGTDTIPLYHVSTMYDSLEHPGYNHKYWFKNTNTWGYNRIEFDKFCSDVGCKAGMATKSSGISSFGSVRRCIFGNPDYLVKSEIVVPPLYEILGFSSEALMDSELPWKVGTAASIIQVAANDSDVSYYKINGNAELPSGVNMPNASDYSRGIIWITGNLVTTNGNESFRHKGLIYVDGIMTGAGGGGTNNVFWVLGALAVQDSIDNLHLSGQKVLCILYSKDALDKTVESNLSYFKILGWKEVY